MKRLIARRPTPATAIAFVALFVALGGVSYGFATGSIDSREIRNQTVQTQDIRNGGVRGEDIRNDSIRTEDLRNNEIRGVDIRNSTIRGVEIALNSIAGEDIAESTLETVPSATTADTLDGLDESVFARAGDLGRFSLKLGDGQAVTVTSHGQVAIGAECIEGSEDGVRIYATTTAADSLMDGVDDHLTAANYLTSTTPRTSAALAEFTRPNATLAEVDETNDGGFVVGSDGKGLHLQGGSTLLGFDYAGGGCIVAGEISRTG